MYVMDADDRNVNGGFSCGGVVTCMGCMGVLVVLDCGVFQYMYWWEGV